MLAAFAMIAVAICKMGHAGTVTPEPPAVKRAANSGSLRCRTMDGVPVEMHTVQRRNTASALMLNVAPLVPVIVRVIVELAGAMLCTASRHHMWVVSETMAIAIWKKGLVNTAITDKPAAKHAARTDSSHCRTMDGVYAETHTAQHRNTARDQTQNVETLVVVRPQGVAELDGATLCTEIQTVTTLVHQAKETLVLEVK